MKMILNDLADKLRSTLGDGTLDISEDFLVNAYNYCITELPMVPKLEKLFSKHKQFNLDASNHYKWSLSDETGFRRISDIPMINFYTSTGGEPCKLDICRRPVKQFYEKNGLVNLKQSGTPCEYTIEVEDDNVYLILDRPSNIPIIVNYIAYGYPKPVESLDDEIEVSAIAEPLILSVMQTIWFRESQDFAFADNIAMYADNKKIIEAVQQLHRQFGDEGPRVLGEV